MGASPESRKAGNPDATGFRARRFAASRNDRGEFFSSLLERFPIESNCTDIRSFPPADINGLRRIHRWHQYAAMASSSKRGN
jgi:hypothetical protein